METLLAEPRETGPPSAETSCAQMATKAVDTQGTLAAISLGHRRVSASEKAELNSTFLRATVL